MVKHTELVTPIGSKSDTFSDGSLDRGLDSFGQVSGLSTSGKDEWGFRSDQMVKE